MEEYSLTVTTSGRYLTAGTDASVYTKLTGSDGVTTKWHKLDYFFKNDFKKGSVETYSVHHKGEHLGPPLIVQFKLKGLSWLDSWFCDEVVVNYNQCKYTFPVYEWVEHEEIAVMKGTASLPQQLTNVVEKTYRKTEMVDKKQKYKWQDKATSKQEFGWGVCRYMNEESNKQVPTLFRKPLGRLKQQSEWSFKASINTATNLFQGLFTKLQVFADYKKLYRHIGAEDPSFIKRWRRDEEMGRQMLNGISPLAIQRCSKLPDYCNITNDDVSACLLPGISTLEEQMSAGKIYIADYTFAQKVKRNFNPSTDLPFVQADCVGLFRVSDDGHLLPIAIQLVPGTRDYIFTPEDDEYDWLLAKMYFRNSAQSFQQWIHRYLHTHAVTETFAVATFRNLSRIHPLYKLLRPHLIGIIDINRQMREEVFPPDSGISHAVSIQIASFVRKMYKTFHLSDLDIPKLLKKRGLDDRELLPIYYYRDDALTLWEAIKSYAGNILALYYTCDEDFKQDTELQSWANDLAHEGFGWQDGNTRGMPEQISSLQQLVDLSTIIVFTSSVQHAAVNSGQMETHQFIPNSPCVMTLPVHKKGEGTIDRIMDSLPDIKTSSTMISYTCALSTFAKDEVFLGEVPENLFIDTEVIQIQKEFKKKLEDISAATKERNETVEQPYTYLLPENIPLCISV